MSIVTAFDRIKQKPLRSRVNTNDSVFPEGLFETGSYRYPIPVRNPSFSKNIGIQELVRKADKDVSLKFEIENILFFYEISFAAVAFDICRAAERGQENMVPIAWVKANSSVSPLTWIAAAGDISNALLKRDLGMLLMDIVSAE